MFIYNGMVLANGNLNHLHNDLPKFVNPSETDEYAKANSCPAE